MRAKSAVGATSWFMTAVVRPGLRARRRPSPMSTRYVWTRPALPRINSMASGLRFCGIRLEPVDTASEKRRNAASWLAKKIQSSARRDR